MEYYYGSIALLAPVYSITKSLPRGYGGGGPCEAWWKGRFERAGIRFDRDGNQQDLEEKLCV